MTVISALPKGPSAPITRDGFLLLALTAGLLWLVAFDGGPVAGALGQAGSFFHELFHDGRHVLGAPCH